MKTEYVRNRTVYNDLNNNHTSATPKIMKNLVTREQFVYKTSAKESTQNHSSDKNENYFRERKSFCFSARSNQLSPNMIPKALLGTLLKQKL